jgi:hypothetical protein
MPVFPVGDPVPGDPGEDLQIYGYEFNGLNFGAGTAIVVEKMEGLLGSSSVRGNDIELTNDHGAAPGTTLLNKRTIAFDLHALGTAGEVEDMLVEFGRVFQLPPRRSPRLLIPLCFWRPGQPKKCVFARTNKRDFDSVYNVAHGKASGSVELVAPDPLIYSLDLHQTIYTLGAGVTTGTFPNIQNDGNHVDGTGALFQVLGPAVDPIFTNVDDDGRAMRFDVNIPAGGGIRFDLAAKSAEVFNGSEWVPDYGIVRNDSEWFKIMPGDNEIVYTRSGTAATGSQVNVWHRDAWS